MVGDQFIITRTPNSWSIQCTVMTPNIFTQPPPKPQQPQQPKQRAAPAQCGETTTDASTTPTIPNNQVDSQRTQHHNTTFTNRPTTRRRHGQQFHEPPTTAAAAAAASSAAATAELLKQPNTTRPRRDQYSPFHASTSTMLRPQVKDNRNIRGPMPTPSPPARSPSPTQDTWGGDHTELRQRTRPNTGASSSTDPFPGDTRQALLAQLQLIRDTATSTPGAEIIATMTDVAAQLLHAAPASTGPSSERDRGRKRPFTDPNALTEILIYADRAGGRESRFLRPS